jgi:hypothetical protein
LLQGRVLWNGQPVARATVYVADSPPGSTRYGMVLTDEQGRFLISGVPEGSRCVGVTGNPQIFAMANRASFTMTAAPFTRDFYLCKGFNPVAPANNESVSGRPVLRWDPFADAARYFVVVLKEARVSSAAGDRRET